MIFYEKVGTENDHGLAILANFGGGSRCYFVRDMFDFVLRARARALPTVGSPAPVRRGLWSLPSSCPSSRTTGRFFARAMGGIGRSMGALCPHGAEREFQKRFLKTCTSRFQNDAPTAI